MAGRKTNRMLRAAASATIGLGALTLVLAAFLLQQVPDIRPILLTAFAGFLVAAWFAPSRLIAAFFGIFPALLLSGFNLAFTDHFYLSAFVGIACLAVSTAAAAAWFKARARKIVAALIVAGASAAAIGVAYRAIPAFQERRAYESVDRPVAPFTLHTLNGETISSAMWRGKMLVVSYWATWCPPCIAEIPKLVALQNLYRNHPMVEIIALNAGYGGDTAEKARAFLERRNLALSSYIDDVYADEAGRRGMAARSLGLKVVPTLFIVSPAGKIIAIHTGYDNSEDLLTTLPRRLSELLATR